jgi:hypothetical protein
MSTEPRRGLRLIEWAIILGIVLVICAIFVPGLMSSHRVENERQATTSLKMLSSAEADFRANDRDWNHVNDFWTGDVKGLYTMTSAAEKGAGVRPKDPPIRLIALDVAAADADPAVVPAGGENMALPEPAAVHKGYWFIALLTDKTLDDAAEATYRQDTGGTPAMGACHNTSKFGFAAFPDSWSTGKYLFLVNENNTIFRWCQKMEPPVARRGTSIPPGRNGLDPTWQHWPSDEDLKRTYHPRGCCDN